MIDKLHNMANTILGLESLKYYDSLYRLLCISNEGYTIKLTNSSGQLVSPIKESREGTIEYSLDKGIYYLRYYLIDEETKTETKKYYEEIYVSSEMLGTSRTLKI